MESNINGFGHVISKIKTCPIKTQQELINSIESGVCLCLDNDIVIDERIVISMPIEIDGQGHLLDVQESGSLYFKDTQDIYIHDVKVIGQGSDWENNLDLLTFDHVSNIVIDKCYIADGADECVGIKNGSDYITISNCVFTYTKKPITISQKKNHNFAILIGKNKDDKPESGIFHVTLYRDRFEGDIRRCPRIRNGLCHIIECEYDTTSVYAIGPELSELVLIDCAVKRRPHEMIHKFGDFKQIVIESGEIKYKNPKFSQFNLPDHLCKKS